MACETVQAVAKRLDVETALKWADHRIEVLEDRIRSHQRTIEGLANCVLNRDSLVREIAMQAIELVRMEREDGWGLR